ncbi:hypothetical protein COM24_06775 [Bacillus toyonensis]|uniref:GerAB/ArcD/ProY family transporter n=1 Tax=Bacillus TaxID=1386 RepID=UPI0008E15C3A|nr:MULTISPECIES: GerAB/ArcD/ProY family transporter [Bacillus]PGC56835.1 hypothetical protein COM24_06775 [Bacillus toyonensis]SFM27535.1 Spore germination protein [Bacillus sp. 5mfcol3.1]
MNKNDLDQISFSQYIFIITGAQIGIGLLQLPRLLAEKAGMNGWVSLFSAWIFSTISSLIIIQIMKITNKTLFQLLCTYTGKWIGKIFMLFTFLYFSFFALFIFVLSTTWMPHIHCAVCSMNNLLGKKNTSPLLCLLLFSFVFIMYFFPVTLFQINFLQNISLYVGVLFSFMFPIFLWIFIKLYKAISQEEIQ